MKKSDCCRTVLPPISRKSVRRWQYNGRNQCELAVEKPDDELLVSVSPNPTNGKLQVISSSTPAEISIVNLFGEQILTIHDEQLVDLSSFDQGVYLLRITYTSGEEMSLRIVKN